MPPSTPALFCQRKHPHQHQHQHQHHQEQEQEQASSSVALAHAFGQQQQPAPAEHHPDAAEAPEKGPLPRRAGLDGHPPLPRPLPCAMRSACDSWSASQQRPALPFPAPPLPCFPLSKPFRLSPQRCPPPSSQQAVTVRRPSPPTDSLTSCRPSRANRPRASTPAPRRLRQPLHPLPPHRSLQLACFAFLLFPALPPPALAHIPPLPSAASFPAPALATTYTPPPPLLLLFLSLLCRRASFGSSL